MLLSIFPLVFLPMILDLQIFRNLLSFKTISFFLILFFLVGAFYDVFTAKIHWNDRNIIEEIGKIKVIEGEQVSIFWSDHVLTFPKTWDINHIKTLFAKDVKIKYYHLKVFPSFKKFKFAINCVLSLDEFSVEEDIKKEKDWRDSFSQLFHLPFLILFIGFGIMSSEVKEDLDARFSKEQNIEIEKVTQLSMVSASIQEILNEKYPFPVFVKLEKILFIEENFIHWIIPISEDDLIQLRKDFTELEERQNLIQSILDKNLNDIKKIKKQDLKVLENNPFLSDFLETLRKYDSRTIKLLFEIDLNQKDLRSFPLLSETQKENMIEIQKKGILSFSNFEVDFFKTKMQTSYDFIISKKQKIANDYFLSQSTWSVPQINRSDLFAMDQTKSSLWKKFYTESLENKNSIQCYIFKKEGRYILIPKDFSQNDLGDFLYLKREYAFFLNSSFLFLILESIPVFLFLLDHFKRRIAPSLKIKNY